MNISDVRFMYLEVTLTITNDIKSQNIHNPLFTKIKMSIMQTQWSTMLYKGTVNEILMSPMSAKAALHIQVKSLNMMIRSIL